MKSLDRDLTPNPPSLPSASIPLNHTPWLPPAFAVMSILPPHPTQPHPRPATLLWSMKRCNDCGFSSAVVTCLVTLHLRLSFSLSSTASTLRALPASLTNMRTPRLALHPTLSLQGKGRGPTHHDGCWLPLTAK